MVSQANATKRGAPLYDGAVKVTADVLVQSMVEIGWTPPLKRDTQKDLDRVTRQILRAYIAAAHESRRAKRDYSETTKQIAAMKEGEVRNFPLQSRQTLRGRFVSARAILDNEAAVWIARDKGDHLEVTRLWDGANAHYRDTDVNPKAVELASLPINQWRKSKTVLTTRGKGQLSSNDKVQARKILGDYEAAWVVRQSADGEGVVIKRLR
jgi:hypothetical protein